MYGVQFVKGSNFYYMKVLTKQAQVVDEVEERRR